jgi:hypothetical protein
MTDLDLTRLTVNLTPRSVKALHVAAEMTELSRTDTVNRALQIYAAMVKSAADGRRARMVADLLGDDEFQEVTISHVRS